jgi:nucleoside-diphosphate-sugar epimerase
MKRTVAREVETMSNTVFITGATGNIGGKLLTTILDKDPDTRIIALIRGESAAVAQSRLEQALRVLAPEFDTALISSRVRVIWISLSINLACPRPPLTNWHRKLRISFTPLPASSLRSHLIALGK